MRQTLPGGGGAFLGTGTGTNTFSSGTGFLGRAGTLKTCTFQNLNVVSLKPSTKHRHTPTMHSQHKTNKISVRLGTQYLKDGSWKEGDTVPFGGGASSTFRGGIGLFPSGTFFFGISGT